ncbi:MAG: (2Fe-2S)-binding protein [Planctomycetaceae bacterium]|nr:(2Fe-2S)-binding protein [Planctomycetaceae bacterium]
MELDDDLCLCFHVTRRKVENFLRVERPKRVAQLSECGGAGTGCGWCRPFLEKLFERSQDSPSQVRQTGDLPDATHYAQQRTQYRQRQNDP